MTWLLSWDWRGCCVCWWGAWHGGGKQCWTTPGQRARPQKFSTHTAYILAIPTLYGSCSPSTEYQFLACLLETEPFLKGISWKFCQTQHLTCIYMSSRISSTHKWSTIGLVRHSVDSIPDANAHYTADLKQYCNVHGLDYDISKNQDGTYLCTGRCSKLLPCSQLTPVVAVTPPFDKVVLAIGIYKQAAAFAALATLAPGLVAVHQRVAAESSRAYQSSSSSFATWSK